MAEHEHHHPEDCCGEEENGLCISTHEGARIATLSGHIAAENVAKAKELLSAAMTELAALIQQNAGVVGHIKAIVSEEGRGYQISVTDDQASVRELLPGAFRAELAAIVFLVEEDALRAYIRETVGALILPSNDPDACGHEHHEHHDHHDHHDPRRP